MGECLTLANELPTICEFTRQKWETGEVCAANHCFCENKTKCSLTDGWSGISCPPGSGKLSTRENHNISTVSEFLFLACTCFCLLSAEIKVEHHHAWLKSEFSQPYQTQKHFQCHRCFPQWHPWVFHKAIQTHATMTLFCLIILFLFSHWAMKVSSWAYLLRPMNCQCLGRSFCDYTEVEVVATTHKAKKHYKPQNKAAGRLSS